MIDMRVYVVAACAAAGLAVLVRAAAGALPTMILTYLVPPGERFDLAALIDATRARGRRFGVFQALSIGLAARARVRRYGTAGARLAVPGGPRPGPDGGGLPGVRGERRDGLRRRGPLAGTIRAGRVAARRRREDSRSPPARRLTAVP